MNIVILANNIDELGGVQRIVHTLAGGLSASHQVDLVGITPYPVRHDYGTSRHYVEHRLMDEQWPPRGDDEARRRRARLRAQAVERLQGLLAERTPGVIIVAQVWAMEILADVDHAGWIVIGQYHGAFAAAATGRDLRRILTSYADVTMFLALTDEDACAFTACGLNNVRVMANPLGQWPRAADPIAPVIGYLGRLSIEKGPDVLLEAWAALAPAHPEWSLRIAGDGPMAEQILRRAAALPRVSVQEPVDDPEAFWAGVGIGAFPSRTEGMPMSLIEAQAAGVPCVATDCSSGVRVLSPTVLVHADAFASGLVALMGDPERRREAGRRARHAMEVYRLDVIVSQWEELFARVVR